MSDPQSPIMSDYNAGSSTTSSEGEIVDALTLPQRSTDLSQTTSSEMDVLLPINQLIEPERYGVAKPRRVVIRGKISRE